MRGGAKREKQIHGVTWRTLTWRQAMVGPKEEVSTKHLNIAEL